MIVKYRRFAEKYKHASIRKHSAADAQLRDDHVDWLRPSVDVPSLRGSAHSPLSTGTRVLRSRFKRSSTVVLLGNIRFEYWLLSNRRFDYWLLSNRRGKA